MFDGPRLKTKIGPYGPFYYTLLSEPQLSDELARLAGARSEVIPLLSAAASASGETPEEGRARIDSVSFQPCCAEEEWSQDRLFVRRVEGRGRNGILAGVFDGHGGHEAVDYAVSTLPDILSSALLSDSDLEKKEPGKILSESLTAFDDSITSDLRSLFPPVDSPEFASLSEEDISRIVNEKEGASPNHAKVLRAMRGSTALVAYVEGDEVWVANLGDCQAILGTKGPDGKWHATRLTNNHNGDNPAERQRVVDEHPGEDATIILERKRILGALAVTRALGDHLFKLPSSLARIFFYSSTPFRFSVRSPLATLSTSKTPPYVSNIPELTHISLPLSTSTSITHTTTDNTTSTDNPQVGKDRFIILCSDGLIGEHRGVTLSSPPASPPSSPPSPHSQENADRTKVKTDKADLYQNAKLEWAAQYWVEIVGSRIDASSSSSLQNGSEEGHGARDGEGNLALELLRGVLESPNGGMRSGSADGVGENEEKGQKAKRRRLSRAMSLEMEKRWMDDTTVMVLRF